MEIIQQGLNLIYHPGERYQEFFKGGYYSNLLPPMEIDGKKFHTLYFLRQKQKCMGNGNQEMI